MSEAALSLRGVAVARGGRRILAGVDLDVRWGETVLVKGANGSGKTTLLRAVAGLMPLAAGTARAGGEADAAGRRARIACAGHADGAKAALTVAENLAFWARLYGAPQERIDAALEALALAPLAGRRAGLLSAGQKRRLGLSRLVVSGKKIWLMDEPAASIDAQSVRRLTDLVAGHCASGGAALVATHDRLDIAGARAVVVEAAP